MVETHLTASEPGIDAGVDSEGIIIEGAGNPIGWCDALGVGDDMVECIAAIPSFSEQPGQGTQSKLPSRSDAQHACRFKISRDRHRVPTGIKRTVDERRWPPAAGGQKLLPRRIDKRPHITDCPVHLGGQFFDCVLAVKHILGRIVVHVAEFADIPVN